MKSTLRSLLLAGTACAVLGAATPAGAITYIIEQPGSYSLFNDSSEPIWKFWVTNPGAAFSAAYSTRALWDGGTYCTTGSCSGNDAFIYSDSSYVSDSVGGGASLDAIQPGETTGFQFRYFAAIASTGHVYFLNGTEMDVPVFAAAPVPVPAALPLMGSVLGAGWLVARWRRRRTVDAPA